MVPFVTFCGRYVRDEPVLEERGEGVECLSCKRVAGKGGTYL